jgi:hypothetical protein
MKRSYAIFAVVFAVSILIGIQAIEEVNVNLAARAELSNGIGLTLASGPYIKSPSNETYDSETFDLYVNFQARIYGNVNYSIVYSLDGERNETVSLIKHNAGWQNQDQSYLDGTADLPTLSNGSHNLTVCAQSVIATYNGSTHLYTANDKQTVYFTVQSPSLIQPKRLQNFHHQLQIKE